MRRRAACFISPGSVLIDLPLHVDRVPVSGGAVTAVSSGPAVGGGYTVVSAVARQGLPAALAATLGTGPNSSQVRQAMMLDGVELVFTDDAIKAIASLALERKTGARGLTSIAEEVLGNAMFEVPSMPEVGRVVVDADAVRGTGRPCYEVGSGTLAAAYKGERSRTA